MGGLPLGLIFTFFLEKALQDSWEISQLEMGIICHPSTLPGAPPCGRQTYENGTFKHTSHLPRNDIHLTTIISKEEGASEIFSLFFYIETNCFRNSVHRFSPK